MSAETARAAIMDYFQNTVWKTGAAEYLPTQYPNAERPAAAADDETWARFSIVEGRTEPLSITRDRKDRRYPGIMYVELFMPENAGVKLASEAFDKIEAAFDNHILSITGGRILFRQVSKKDLGSVDGFNKHNIMVEFVRDEST